MFVDDSQGVTYALIRHEGNPQLYNLHKYIDRDDADDTRHTCFRTGSGRKQTAYEKYSDHPHSKSN